MLTDLKALSARVVTAVSIKVTFESRTAEGSAVKIRALMEAWSRNIGRFIPQHPWMNYYINGQAYCATP